jgi:hypothetical protein
LDQATGGNQATLEIRDVKVTAERMDLYILWLYSYNAPLISKWMDTVWPDDELEGTLQLLILACHVPGEVTLFHQALGWAQQIFSIELSILTTASSSSPVAMDALRHSVARSFELVFEQEMNVAALDGLREQMMVNLFKKANELVPELGWLNQWIGRCPGFRAEFVFTRMALLRSGLIKRRRRVHVAELAGQDMEAYDRLHEAFDDIWLGPPALGAQPNDGVFPGINVGFEHGFAENLANGPDNGLNEGLDLEGVDLGPGTIGTYHAIAHWLNDGLNQGLGLEGVDTGPDHELDESLGLIDSQPAQPNAQATDHEDMAPQDTTDGATK